MKTAHWPQRSVDSSQWHPSSSIVVTWDEQHGPVHAMETAGTGNTSESVVHLDCQYGTIWRGSNSEHLFRGWLAQLSMEQGLLYVLTSQKQVDYQNSKPLEVVLGTESKPMRKGLH